MNTNTSNSRRSFIKKVTQGLAVTTISASATSNVYSKTVLARDNHSPWQKPIRIGIIGAENSHTIGFGRLFNIDRKFPGVEVLYVWGETDEFARIAQEKGKIPNIVKDPNEMLGKIDALIVDHRHAKYHLEPAIPFIKAGIPTFIDKPFCYRVAEGKDFLALARSLGTPVSSWSTNAHNDRVLDLKQQLKTMGQINQVVSFGPVDIESIYGGVFFYGVHFVDQLLALFGDNITKVRVSRNGKNASAVLAFNDGMLANLIFLTASRSRGIYAETSQGVIELISQVEEADPARTYVDMVEMFRTGKEPRSHESILFGIAVLEALERSVSSDKWEDVRV